MLSPYIYKRCYGAKIMVNVTFSYQIMNIYTNYNYYLFLLYKVILDRYIIINDI